MNNVAKVRKELEESLNSDMSLEEIVTTTEKLDRLKKVEDIPWYKRIKPETFVAATVELTGLILVLNYDQVKVISNKGLSFLNKMKVS